MFLYWLLSQGLTDFHPGTETVAAPLTLNKFLFAFSNAGKDSKVETEKNIHTQRLPWKSQKQVYSRL